MIKPRQLIRLCSIYRVLMHYDLDQMLVSLHWLRPLRFMLYLNPWYLFRRPTQYPRGVALRLALEELGPIFVKFGQALSTRRDLIDEDIAEQLELLQDSVPPFPSEIALNIIEKTYEKPVDELFHQFDPQALASASIAQVHAAELADGRQVIVKIARPHIELKIKRDLELMYLIADWIERFWEDGKRLRAREVIAEFEYTILNELDFIREGANASTLRRNFENSPLLYVPEMYWPYIRKNILVMERIYGIPITDLAALQRAHVNIKKLAERGVEIFFTQVFRDSFFYADMHPGNIFVDASNPAEPKYICVDFGIVGSLNTRDQRYLAEIFHAFFHRDYRRVAELHVESGWVAYDTRVTEFEAAIRTVCEPIFERPLKDISAAVMLMQLFHTGREFNMEIQPQLMLLQKTLFAIEGLGRQLYPDLNLWLTAKPFLAKWIKARMSPRTFLKEIKQQLPRWSEHWPQIPELIYDVLTQKQREYQQSLSLRALQKAEYLRYLYLQKSLWLCLGIGFGLLTSAAFWWILK